MLVGRGDNAMGPWYAQPGNQLTEDLSPPVGTLVLGSHDNVYAPGGARAVPSLLCELTYVRRAERVP